MVDSFCELREVAEKRGESLRDECFICGYSRSAYDDLGGDYNFDNHIFQEHNLWNYLYFIHYLREKDPTEYNGVESCKFWHVEFLRSASPDMRSNCLRRCGQNVGPA